MGKEYIERSTKPYQQTGREKEILYGRIRLSDSKKVVAMCSLCGGGSDCSCGSCGICNCGSCDIDDLAGRLEEEWI